MPSTSTKKRRLSSGFGVRSSACPIRARSWIGSVTLDEPPQAVEVVRELAGLELRALLALALLALEGRREHLLDPLLLDDDRAVRVEHDDVALADRARRRPRPDSPIAPGTRFSAPLHADVARPDRQPELTELLEVADGGVHQERRDARDLRLRREELADERDGRWARASSARGPRRAAASATAAWTIRLSSWPQRTVRAGPAAREPGHDLDQRHVDDLRAPGRLVDGRRPEPRELGEHVRHSALTTCGVTRWNASAYRIAELPDERRAWLPRCSARWA